MKLGMLHLFENPVEKSEHQIVHEQMSIMRAAEDLGFESVWPAEHHFSEYGYCASPALSLAALAATTKRLRLGTGVVVLPFNHPLRVAEDYAFLDLLSDGRVDLGLGRGYQPHEFEGYGVDQTKSKEMFDEGVEVILQAWTQEEVNFNGTHYQFNGVRVRPKPLQQPHPPIWMAALSPQTFALAGAKGFNLLCAPVFGFSIKDAAVRLAEYRKALEEAGHDPAEKQIAALMMVYVADTTEQARREFSDRVLWYYRTIGQYIAPKQGSIQGYEFYSQTRVLAASVSWDQLVQAGMVICGSPEHCVERIAELRKSFGFNLLLCWTRLGGLDHRKVIRSMELMRDRVIPCFAEA